LLSIIKLKSKHNFLNTWFVLSIRVISEDNRISKGDQVVTILERIPKV